MSELRLGLRVADVAAAASFYGGLGFEQDAAIAGADGKPLLAILRLGGATLVVDALQGLPFPDTPRERRIKRGPRGLGIVVGLTTHDFEAAFDYCRDHGCAITTEPRDEPWGERVFTFLDPFGYEWELATQIADVGDAEALAATRREWLGTA